MKLIMEIGNLSVNKEVNEKNQEILLNSLDFAKKIIKHEVKVQRVK